MTFIEDQAALAARQEEANIKALNLEGLRAVLAAFPQIQPNEANIKMLESTSFR
jgi:hypothetical protein